MAIRLVMLARKRDNMASFHISHTKDLPELARLIVLPVIIVITSVILLAISQGFAAWGKLPPASAAEMASPTPTPIPPPRVRVVMGIVDPLGGQVSIGSNVTFRVTIQNVGLVSIAFLWLLDQYPPDCLAYVTSMPPALDDGNGHITWPDFRIPSGILQPGGSLSVSVTFRVVAECPNMVNYVLVSGLTSHNQRVPPAYDGAPVRVVPPILYCKCPWPDYAPTGMPDFSQKQEEAQNPRTNAWSYSGPAAVANALWEYDSEFEANTVPPPRIADNYPLVQSYNAAWDDHDLRNVLPLIQELAFRMDTDGQRTGDRHDGTDIWDMCEGARSYIAEKGLGANYTVTVVDSPTFEWVNNAVRHGDDVVLLLGFWEAQQGGWRRLGGHYATVSCVTFPGDPASILEISDPYWDRAEYGWPGRSVPAQPHNHPSLSPDTIHNDAAYLSWDLFNVTPLSLPKGTWGPQNYITLPNTINDFWGQNFTEETERYRAPRYTSGDILTVAEYALSIRALVDLPPCPRPSPAPTPTPTPTPPANVRMITLQQGRDGYAGVQDTYLNSWYPTLSYGRASLLQIRSGDLMAPLLRFDLSSIPRQATVVEAILTLYAVSGGYYEEDVSVFEVYTPWIADQATWREAWQGVPWAEVGCNGVGLDRSGDANDTAVAIASTPLEFHITELVQKWVANPAANFGVVLKGSLDISVQHNLASSEYWNVSQRPKLVVRYWVAP